MSIRNLDSIFRPKSIALVGASQTRGTEGEVLARNLFRGGFSGPILPVHPREVSVAGALAYPDVDALPLVPDLAVITAPPDEALHHITALIARGTRAIVMVSKLDEAGDRAPALQQQILDVAKPHLARVLGPECLGVIAPRRGLDASLSPTPARPGNLAFISQSGVMMSAVLDWAAAREIGFSVAVALGRMADVDTGDLIDYLGQDHATRAILLYVEAVADARKFMSAARAAARLKPVVVIKGGRSERIQHQECSHARLLIGADDVYDAAFQRSGLLRVGDLDELFQAAATLGSGIKVRGARLGILSNGWGPALLALDALETHGGSAPSISDDATAFFRSLLPPSRTARNPVALPNDASPEDTRRALEVFTNEKGLDAVLVIQAPHASAPGLPVAEAVLQVARGTRMPILTTWLGEAEAQPARELFRAHRIPTYETPSAAVQGFLHLVDYRQSQSALDEVPPAFPERFHPRVERAKAICEQALHDGRRALDEADAKELLTAYEIPVIQTGVGQTPEQAAEIAAALARPVVLKIRSPDILHKTDVGGVVLGLTDPEDVRRAAEIMAERVHRARPDANLTGFLVQPLAQVRDGTELYLGFVTDPVFGPVIAFGRGGIEVDAVRDRAVGLPPLNLVLARHLIERTRVYRVLRGFRNRPPVALDELAFALVKVAQMAADLGQVAELDINPLVAHETGVIALDAQVILRDRPETPRLAIRPYPNQLERTVDTHDGRTYLLRPMRPEDAPLAHEMVRRTDPEDLRLRFFSPIKTIPDETMARLTQLDYDREMALCAVARDQSGQETLYGVVRIAADPDNLRAEYAVIVRSDQKGKGLGTVLMREILDYAKSRGIQEVVGEVLAENSAMLHVCRELGFQRALDPEDPKIVKVRVRLHESSVP